MVQTNTSHVFRTHDRPDISTKYNISINSISSRYRFASCVCIVFYTILSGSSLEGRRKLCTLLPTSCPGPGTWYLVYAHRRYIINNTSLHECFICTRLVTRPRHPSSKVTIRYNKMIWTRKSDSWRLTHTLPYRTCRRGTSNKRTSYNSSNTGRSARKRSTAVRT